MNERIIEISDRIARNEDISMEEFTKLKGYIFKSNKGKKWNREDVFSNYVLDVRENYNPDLSKEEKEARIYAHIKKAITRTARFDSWTLYSPLPIPMGEYEIEWNNTPQHTLQIEMEEEEIKDIYNILHTPLEKDIYINCILWNTPVAYIAKEHNRSAEWWRIIKDRIWIKIKEYIENKGK